MPVFILEHLEKDKKIKRLEIEKDTILVGRHPDAEIALRDSSVSKRHLVIKLTSEGYCFEDLGSQNGTYINNIRVSEGRLKDHDILRVGRIQITFLLDEDPGAAEIETSRAVPPPESAAEPAPTQARPEIPPDTDAPAVVAGQISTSDLVIEPGSSPPDSSTGALLEPTVSRPSSAGPQAPDIRGDVRESDSSSHRATLLIWGGIIVAGIGFGFGMGYLTSLLEEIDRNSTSTMAPTIPEENVQPEADNDELTSKPRVIHPTLDQTADTLTEGSMGTDIALQSMKGFPGLLDNPLGPYQDRKESLRVLYRLYLDLLDRPPTRQELVRGMMMHHRERWDALRSRLPREDRAITLPSEAFQKYLGRDPTPEEFEFIQNTPYEVVEELGLWLSATKQYRSPSHRRDKSLRQLANSLIVDLQDRIPVTDQHLAVLEDTIIELPDLTDIARTLSATAPRPSSPRAAREITRQDITAEVFRFVQKQPRQETLDRLHDEVNKIPQGLRLLRLALARSEDYWRF